MLVRQLGHQIRAVARVLSRTPCAAEPCVLTQRSSLSSHVPVHGVPYIAWYCPDTSCSAHPLACSGLGLPITSAGHACPLLYCRCSAHALQFDHMLLTLHAVMIGVPGYFPRPLLHRGTHLLLIMGPALPACLQVASYSSSATQCHGWTARHAGSTAPGSQTSTCARKPSQRAAFHLVHAPRTSSRLT